MGTIRLRGDSSISNESIERYVRRFGPVTTGQIRRALGAKKDLTGKRIGQCENLRCTGRTQYKGREMVWEYIDP